MLSAYDLPLSWLQLVQTVNAYISQGSVATHLRCGGILNDHFIASFLGSVSVKEFLKSTNIWWRYAQQYGVSFFLTHGVEQVAIGIPGNLYGMLLIGTMWGGGGGRYWIGLADTVSSSAKPKQCNEIVIVRYQCGYQVKLLNILHRNVMTITASYLSINKIIITSKVYISCMHTHLYVTYTMS